MLRKMLGVDKMVQQEREQYLKLINEVQGKQQELKDLERELRKKQGWLDNSLADSEKTRVELKITLKENQEKQEMLDRELENVQYLDDCGFYTDLNKLVFTYGTSQEYKQAIQENLDKQKAMIEDEKVCKWEIEWTVENSIQKGRKMMKDTSKMVVRCFNSECNAIIGNIGRASLESVNNKITKSFDQINKLQKTRKMQMSQDFLDLKLEQAKLVFEQQLKNKEEKELEAQRRAELREQEKLEKEIQKEKDKALKEKQQYLKEMARLAKQKQQTQELLDRIAELEAQVNAIDETIDSLDERGSVTCKAGWVYIISQPGSDEVKIGTTRRLDPYERINELGSASVPFKFNTHAVLFAEDAFALENQLHKHFTEYRVNKANTRKEFFTVTPQEVAEYVHNNIDKHVEFDFNPVNEEYEMSK